MEFIPDDFNEELDVPFFEDATNADGVVGYTTGKSVKQLKSMITTGFGRLGGSVTGFQSGKFGNRYGFRIEFTFNGVPGRMDISALPIRKATEVRIDKAKRHALYSVWQRLQAQYNSMLIMPGDVPLVPYMLNASGQTILEVMRESGQIPALPTGEESVIEGEFKNEEKRSDR